MKINFSVSTGNEKDKIINFLETNGNFNFVAMSKIKLFNFLKFIILKKDISDKNLSDILKSSKNSNTQIVAHKFLQEKIPLNYKVIFYPIEISTFKKMIEKYNEINTSLEDIFLSQDSFLINSNNQKKVYVTEKEFEIIQLFFKNIIVKKIQIQEQVLNFQKNLDTKSLDSHLTRIRNKFLKIDSRLNIYPVDSESLEIKKLI